MEETKNPLYPENVINDILSKSYCYPKLTAEMVSCDLVKQIINDFEHRQCFIYLVEQYQNNLSCEEIAKKYDVRKESVKNSIRSAKGILSHKIKICWENAKTE